MRGNSPHYSKGRSDYQKLERRKNKHGRSRSRDKSYEEPHPVDQEEVIEIHGSSSEADMGSPPRRKHKHSHKHRKHRRRDHTPEDDSVDCHTIKDGRHKKHKRIGEEKVLLENVLDSQEKDSYSSDRRHRKDKNIEERHSKERNRRKEEKSPQVRSRNHDNDLTRHRSEVIQERPRIKEERTSSPRRDRIKEESMLRDRSRVKEESREYSLSRVKVERESRDDLREDTSESRISRPGRGRLPIKNESLDNDYAWGQSSNSADPVAANPTEKDKPDFKLSGKLTEDRNTFNGVVVKYSEPPEARMPKKRWRLYQFKGDESLPILYIHRQSAYLIGRDRKVADLPVDHPSCSKQHAALQYRLVTFERPNGTVGKQIRLYVIDLESANGTFINGNKIEPKKYVELLEKDVIKFGMSSREYVLLHEQSKDDELSDDD